VSAVYARAPASSANLGPGFDALGLALDLHVEVTVSPADRLRLTTSGEGADLPADASHLAARVASAVAGHDRLAIDVRSKIPVGRGLGSSAALAVAAAAAAAGGDDVATAACAQGAAVDGHPENAAASAYGGLVAATMVDGRITVRRLAFDPELAVVLVIPDRTLRTPESRQVLPETVPFADAAFNLGRMGLLVAGLADRRQLIAAAFDDRLHQDARARLFPEAGELLGRVHDAGARGVCWSGAGPTLLAICDRDTTQSVENGAQHALSAAGVPGRVLVCGVDRVGVTRRRDVPG
jgi:homoserine kinase